MNNPEDNKKEVAKRMLTEVMENIDFSKVTLKTIKNLIKPILYVVSVDLIKSVNVIVLRKLTTHTSQ
jgi:hypothetical protein